MHKMPKAFWNPYTFGLPRKPALYDLNLSLCTKTSTDTVATYFGMRSIETRDGQVLLNHHPLYQRLLLDQGYWSDSHLTPPSEEALVEDIDKTIQLGYNGVRKHMKVEDERFLYWADVKGLLVWSEFPATFAFGDDAIEAFTEQWMEVVRQNYSHPSIITWTPLQRIVGRAGHPDRTHSAILHRRNLPSDQSV